MATRGRHGYRRPRWAAHTVDMAHNIAERCRRAVAVRGAVFDSAEAVNVADFFNASPSLCAAGAHVALAGVGSLAATRHLRAFYNHRTRACQPAFFKMIIAACFYYLVIRARDRPVFVGARSARQEAPRRPIAAEATACYRRGLVIAHDRHADAQLIQAEPLIIAASPDVVRSHHDVLLLSGRLATLSGMPQQPTRASPCMSARFAIRNAYISRSFGDITMRHAPRRIECTVTMHISVTFVVRCMPFCYDESAPPPMMTPPAPRRVAGSVMAH